MDRSPADATVEYRTLKVRSAYQKKKINEKINNNTFLHSSLLLCLTDKISSLRLAH